MNIPHCDQASAVSEHHLQLRAAMEAYLEELEAGRYPQSDDFVKKYSSIADELRRHLTGLDFIHLAGPTLGKSNEPSSIPEDAKELGDFRLIREIGRGGMGVVYEAEQMSLRRRVAVKILPFAALLDQRQLERFRNEARAAAMLKHPNIVSVYSVSCERSVHFYAMELVEGRSIAELLQETSGDRTGGRLPPDSPTRFPTSDPDVDTRSLANLTTTHDSKADYFRLIATLGLQLSDALQYAHEQGVVHRDIKPSNLMIDNRGNPWITDFGLAQIQGNNQLTMSGDVVGTLRYMSPEQAVGTKLLDHRTDIYSLGISIYELLIKRPAFSGTMRHRLLDDVVHQQPTRPRQVDSTIPLDLETIVLKAIAKEPEGRYASATEMADDLRRFLEHKPIQARRASRSEWVCRWARRNPVMAFLVTIVTSLLVLLAVGGPLVAFRQHDLSEKTRAQNYVLSINAADNAWKLGDVQRTRQLLSQHIPALGESNLRGFEWHFLWGRCDQIRNIPMLPHPETVDSIAYSPNGRTLVTASRDGFLRLWDTDTQSLKRQARERDAELRAVAYAPNGRLIAAAGTEGYLRLYDAQDLEEGPVLHGHQQRIQSLAFSIDSTQIASAGNDSFVILWSLEHEGGDWQPELLSNHDSWVTVVAFSPDGKLLASSSKDGTVNLWGLPDGKLLRRLSSETMALATTFSSNGKLLAIAGLDVLLYRTDTWELVQRIHRPVRNIVSLVFSPSDEFLVIGGAPVMLWDLSSRKPIAINAHGAGRGLTLSPDGDTLANYSPNDAVRLHDIQAMRKRIAKPLPHPVVTRIAFATSNSRDVLVTVNGPLGSGVGQLRIWDIATLQESFKRDFEFPMYCVARSPRESHLVVTGGGNEDTGEVILWDLNTKKVVTKFLGHTRSVSDVVFSPDGRLLASASFRFNDPEKSEIIVWDVKSRKRLTSFHDLGALSLAFSPDGQRLYAGCSGDRFDPCRRIKCFDVHRGELVCTVHTYKNPGNYFYSLCTMPDGRLFAAGGSAIFTWLPGAPTFDKQLQGQKQVVSVTVSPDGKSIATGAYDGTVRMWRTSSGDDLLTIDMPTSVSSVTFSEDGSKLAAGCIDRSVILVTAEGREEVLRSDD